MTQPVLPSAIIDLRPGNPPPAPDQGSRPTCLAMSITGAHDFLAAEAKEPSRAAEALWWSAVQMQGHARGTTLPVVRAALEQDGQPEDALWPYPTARLSPDPEQPPTSCGPSPWRVAAASAMDVRGSSFERDCEAHLAQGRPVVVIVQVTDEFAVPDPHGIIAVPARRAPSYGAHAVLVMGMRDIDVRGRYLIIRNSWGPHWGNAGYALLPLAYLATHGIQAAVVHEPT